MLSLAWLIPALPLLGFAILLASGRRIGEPVAGYIATAASGASFLVAAGVFLKMI